MVLALTKRAVKGVELTATDHDSNMTAIEDAVNGLGNAGISASGVTNDSTVTGSSVKLALDNLQSGKADLASTTSALALKVATSQVGAANGVASLDGSGKVPAAQLNISSSTYKGTWNASTNTPALAAGTGTNGDFYKVSAAGTRSIGEGSVAYSVGDAVVYNATGGIWQKIGAADAVSSVFGRLGAVVAAAGDYSDTQVSAPASATNYSPTGATVRGHLAGIDAKIATLATGGNGGSVDQQTSTAQGAGPTLTATEAQVGTSVTITPSATTAKILVAATLECVKDAGTTARQVTARLRRGALNTDAQVGQDSIVRSQGVATTAFGPAVFFEVDAPNTTAAVTYTLRALVDVASGATTPRYRLRAVELRTAGSGASGGIERRQSAQTGADAEARLNALKLATQDGDTLFLDESISALSAPVEWKGFTGLTVKMKRNVSITMSGTTGWGTTSDDTLRFGLGFFDCVDLTLDGVRMSMNSAANSAKTGYWSAIFVGTDNRAAPSSYSHVADGVTFRDVRITDVVAVGVLCRQVTRVRVEGRCRFNRLAASIAQDAPLMAILDGAGHRVYDAVFEGGLPDGQAYSGSDILTYASGLQVAPSNPYEFWNPRTNSLRPSPFMLRFSWPNSAGSTPQVINAANGLQFPGQSWNNWGSSDPEIAFDFNKCDFYSTGVNDNTVSWVPEENVLAVTAQNTAGQTVTFTPLNRFGSAAFLDRQEFYVCGYRTDRMVKDVLVQGCTFKRTKGVGIFPWLCKGLTVKGCHAEDCLDICYDCEFCIDVVYSGNTARATKALNFRNSFMSVLYGALNVTFEDNTLTVDRGAWMFRGIDLGPNAMMQRRVRLLNNTLVGCRIEVAGRTLSGFDLQEQLTVKGNDISGAPGKTDHHVQYLLDIGPMQNAVVEHNVFSAPQDVACRFAGLRGFRFRFNHIYDGGWNATLCQQLNNPITGACDSRDVVIEDNIGHTQNNNGCPLVLHDSDPGTRRPRTGRNQVFDFNTGVPLARVVEKWGTTALVPKGIPAVSVDGGWIRISGTSLQFSINSTDGSTGTWTTVT